MRSSNTDSVPTAFAPFVSRKRILWAVIATASFFVPIVWTLASPPSPDPVETQMVPNEPRGESILIPFTDISPAGKDERIHRMPLNSPVAMEILQHPEIRILFSLDERRLPHPATGRLEVVGTPCVYETPKDSSIADGRTMTFVRAGRCRPSGSRPTGELKLAVTMAGPGQLQLWTRELPIDRGSAGLVYVRDSRPQPVSPQPLAVRGVFVDYLPDGGLRRVNLLSYMSTQSVESARIWCVLGGSALLLFVGALVFPMASIPKEGAGRRHFAMAAVAGAFCFATAFAVLYAMLVPPLQAADEPSFVISYGALMNQPWIVDQTQQLARDTQFERIRFHSTERFRARDIGHPLNGMSDFSFQPMSTRSSLTLHQWAAFHRVLPDMSAARTLIVLRILNAAIFGAAVATGTVLLVFLSQVSYPQLLCFPFLFVPTLPFFAMQLSETAVLASATVLFASTVLVSFLDGESAHWAGLPLGLTAAALFATTRSSLPMAGMVGTVAIARIALGSRDARQGGSKALVFWAGLLIGACSFFVIASPSHIERITRVLVPIGARLPSGLASFIERSGAWLPAIVALAGWCLEIVVQRVRTATAPLLAARSVALVRVVAGLAAAAIVMSLIGSLWWTYPNLDSLQGQAPMAAREYVMQVEATMATMFRLVHPSLFLSTSFWVGFGWLDTLPNDAFCSFLVVLTGLSLVGLLADIAITADIRRLTWLIVFVCGSAVTLALYAIAAHQLHVNLHGRYLIGWYVSVVAVMWTFPAVADGARLGRLRDSVPALRPEIFEGLWLLVNGYALCFILGRYL